MAKEDESLSRGLTLNSQYAKADGIYRFVSALHCVYRSMKRSFQEALCFLESPLASLSPWQSKRAARSPFFTAPPGTPLSEDPRPVSFPPSGTPWFLTLRPTCPQSLLVFHGWEPIFQHITFGFPQLGVPILTSSCPTDKPRLLTFRLWRLARLRLESGR